MNIKTASNTQIMNAIKAARALYEENSVAFLLLLRDVEQQRKDVWSANGILSFDMFLNTYHLINASRYREFCAGYEHIGDPAQAFRMGEGIVAELKKFSRPTAAKLAKMDEWSQAFKVEHKVLPSAQTAREWRNKLEPSDPKSVRFASELNVLRAENQKLRAVIRERDREIVELKTKLAGDKKKLRKTA